MENNFKTAISTLKRDRAYYAKLLKLVKEDDFPQYAAEKRDIIKQLDRAIEILKQKENGSTNEN